MDVLLEKERIARLSSDNTAMLAVFQELADSVKDTSQLLSITRILGKRKGLLRDPYKWLINRIFNDRASLPYQEFVSFTSALLKDIVEGKMFLEEERMRISLFLMQKHEEAGNLREALLAVFAVPVETFSSAEEGAVVDYQLEQLRMCIANSEWGKADICGRRVRMRYFRESGDKEREMRFYERMVEISLGQHRFLEASRFYRLMGGRVGLSSFYALLAGMGVGREREKDGVTTTLPPTHTTNSATKLLMENLEDKENVESVRGVIRMFISQEIINKEECLRLFKSTWSTLPVDEYDSFIRQSIDEHNFYVLSRFFSVAALDDLSVVMQCSVDELVEKACCMVNAGMVECRIDQSRGGMKFGRLVDEWGVGVNGLLDKVIKANHLIHKENLKVSE